MLVPRFIEVLVPLFLCGYVMLVGVRFVRGTNHPKKGGSDAESGRMWRILGKVFLALAVYFFLTRFFR